MNITKKIIITDTNIITDLSHANVLENFVNLDNVYMSDMVKNDEINIETCDIDIIDKIKIIDATAEQITEIFNILQNVRGLSQYDIINYIIARDNDAILATGDRKLNEFSTKNGVEVIRTLKIIKLMKDNEIITIGNAIDACIRLKNEKRTRIPIDDINNMIDEFEKDLLKC